MLLTTGRYRLQPISSIPKRNIENFKLLLGDGYDRGIDLSYEVQPSPVRTGLAKVFIIGEVFIGNEDDVLILSDIFFTGTGFVLCWKQRYRILKGPGRGMPLFIKAVKDLPGDTESRKLPLSGNKFH